MRPMPRNLARRPRPHVSARVEAPSSPKLHGRFEMRKPNFFIVGAPRCGTTSLWAYLKGHPDIFMSSEKELYFFDSDFRVRKGSTPTLAEYLNHFSGAGDEKKVGEATPSYLRSQRAAQDIKALCPRAQIIIMLRNPVDVMHSLHNSALDGSELNTDLEAALKADAERTGRDRIGYREFADFPEQVRRYFDLFGRENVHTIIYDELRENPSAVCRSVLHFLGVRADYAPELPWINSNRQARNLRLQWIVRRPPPVLRGIGHLLMPRWLRPRVQRVLANSNLVAKPRAPMDPNLRRRLQKEFEPKVAQLGKLIGRDLSCWCKEPVGEARVGSD